MYFYISTFRSMCAVPNIIIIIIIIELKIKTSSLNKERLIEFL
jgi:hypothetical protein